MNMDATHKDTLDECWVYAVRVWVPQYSRNMTHEQWRAYHLLKRAYRALARYDMAAREDTEEAMRESAELSRLALTISAPANRQGRASA